MPWLEVETKIRVHNRKVKEMRNRIMKIANFRKRERKGDDYFAIKNGGYPKKAFRIRNIGDEHTVNFKKWLTKYWDKDVVVKQEFEFRIKTIYLEHFLQLLRDLGFQEWVKKRKYSESYTYKKNEKVNIELNKVKHLGYFIEIEYLCQPRYMKKAKKTIRQVLKELQVKEEDIDNTGYTKMLWNKGIKDRKFFMWRKIEK